MAETCLLDPDNPRNPIENGVLTEGPTQTFTENEVPEQLGKLGLYKAREPDDLPIEAVKT